MKARSRIAAATIAISLAVAFLYLPTGCKPTHPTGTTQLTLGACLPLTGPVASYGERARKGMELALRDLAVEGEAPINIAFEDNEGKTQVAVAATTKLIDQQKVPVVIGSASSGVTMAMTTVGNQRQVVIFSPIASSPELTSKGGAYFFRVAPSDTAQAKVMADWFGELGLKRIAVAYFTSTWGQSLFESVSRHLADAGGEVVASEAIQEGQQDYRTLIEKLKASNPEALYVPTHGKEGGAFVKQARQLGVDLPIFGGDVWSSPEFVEVGGSATEGCRYVAPARLSGARFDEFAAQYGAAYGEPPEVYAAYSYDTVMILAQAARSGARTGDAIRSYLLTMPPFEGVSGPISFDQNGDVIGRGFDRFEIADGLPKVVE